MQYMNIGEAVRRRRMQLKLTLQQTVERMDIDFDTGNLSRAERGRQQFTTESLQSVARALDISLSSLMNADDTPSEIDHPGEQGHAALDDLEAEDLEAIINEMSKDLPPADKIKMALLLLSSAHAELQLHGQ